MELFKNRVITKFDWLIIGLSLFLLVIATLVYFLALGFLNGDIDKVRDEFAKTQAQLNEARMIAARKDGLLMELEQVRQAIAEFESRLPTDKEVPKLLSQFQRIAELSGVKYQSINAEPIEEKEIYVRLPFKVRVKGKYPEIGEFLRSLEFGDRFINVQGLDVGAEDKGSSEANFVISTYMFVTKGVGNESGVTQS